MADDGRFEDANAPLMAHEEREEDDRRSTRAGRERSTAADAVTLTRAGKVVWLLTFSASLSGLLFGYDTGVISSTLVSIGSDLSGRALTTVDKSLITAITSLLALAASPVTGWLADTFGRKRVIFLAGVLFTLGALVQCFARVVWVMVVGRAIVGAAVGMASCATPLYITELAPAEIRGRLVTIQSLFITGGQVVAYLIGWFFSHFDHGWRWMVGFGAVPAIAQLGLLELMPETPRWLVQSGQERRAETVLRKIYSGLRKSDCDKEVEHVLGNIKMELAEEHKLRTYSGDGDEDFNKKSDMVANARELFRVPGNRRSLTIACLLQGVQQLCGFNSLMYFSATIFELVGYDSPIATSLNVAATNFIFTVGAFLYIDSVGRRRILLRSMPVMVVGLLSCSFAFSFIYKDQANHENPKPWDMYNLKENTLWPRVLLFSMILYVAAYAIGLGCVPWQQSELFPLRVRSLGSAIATSTNWSSNFIIGVTFLPLMEVLGPSITFVLYALICVCGWLAIWRVYPETAGLELEGIGELLKDGWGVEESVRSFKARRKARWEAKVAREEFENSG